MFKKTITYTDYEGVERTEEFLFNLNKAEIIELAYSEKGGLQKYVERITKEEDNKKLIAIFKELLLLSYGVKSDDGKRFIKSAQLSEEFSQTEAFVELFMELATNDATATAFINGISPVEIGPQDHKAPSK